MFTGTPPQTKRDSRKVSHNKRNSNSHTDFALPPIRAQQSVSYGAEHVTMPPLRRTLDTKIGLATQLAPDQVNNARQQRKELTDDLELSGDEEDKENDSSEWRRDNDFDSEEVEDLGPRKPVSRQTQRRQPETTEIYEDPPANTNRRRSAGTAPSKAPGKKAPVKTKKTQQAPQRTSVTPAPIQHSDSDEDDRERVLRGLSPQKSSQILSGSDGEMPPPPAPGKQRSTAISDNRQTLTPSGPTLSQSPMPWRDESSINRELNESDMFAPPTPTSPPLLNTPGPLAAPIRPLSRRSTPAPTPPSKKAVASETATREAMSEKNAYKDSETVARAATPKPKVMLAQAARVTSTPQQRSALSELWNQIYFCFFMAYPLLLRLFGFWMILMICTSVGFYYGHTEGGFLTSFRQLGMKHNILSWGPMYKAPTTIATTLDEVADRLKIVEEHLEGVHRKVREDTSVLAYVKQKTEDLHVKMDTAVTSGSEQAQKITEMLKHVQRLDVALQQQKLALETSGKTDVKRKEALDALEAELRTAKERMRKIEDRTAVLESGYDDIKKELPQQIALQMDSNGHFRIRPEFLRALQQHIKEKDSNSEVSRLKKQYEDLQKEVGKGSSKLSKGDLSSAEKKKLEGELAGVRLRVEETERELERQKKTLAKVQKDNAESQYNWKDWLRQNEQGLRAFVNREANHVVQHGVSEGTIVTKETFMQLLKEKADADSAKLEKRLQSFIDKSMKAQPSSGKAASSLLQHQYELLVETPDYAAWSLGSRIDPSVTSPTFFNGGTIARYYHQIVGLEHPPPIPANILIDGTDLGQNWAFPGQTGQVGIILPTKVFPTDIVISHARYETAVQKDSAPRKCELWVSVRSADARERLIKAAGEALKTSVTPESGMSQQSVKVAEFEYEFKEGANQHQVFSIPISLHGVLGDGNGIEKVIFKVVSNWGHPDWTSLYRVRVHGERDMGSANGYDKVDTKWSTQQARGVPEQDKAKMAT
ncbi:hypothetical protein BJ508DRAFT_301541 [Ascobolus immersus RN42]|uniref:SUN domain-containing protein n=1 Tax=Ascobolus immersus RN42 TaxID=1160509 RepID=A0A3N4ILH5_ASCIM|nr:hypothetical protein BJ508DRAFT_301541 [Ascobolus immersus RN42]